MRSSFDMGAKQMKDILLRILDMECAACVARLDRALEKLPGVQRAAVNYAAASALITYDERVTDLAAIAARVKRAGFRVPVEEQDLLPAEADAARTAAAADALRAVFGVKGVTVQADGTLTAYLWPIGVLDAAVSFWRAELTVRYDPQIVTEAELRRVLSDCGYPACEKGAPGSNPLRNALKSALGRRPEG